MKPASAKAKGRKLQQEVAELIRKELGFTEDDVQVAMSSEKGLDVQLLSEELRFIFPFGIECKNTERIRLWDALAQCERNAEEAELYPLLVFRRNRSRTYATLPLEVLMRLIVKLQDLRGEQCM